MLGTAYASILDRSNRFTGRKAGWTWIADIHLCPRRHLSAPTRSMAGSQQLRYADVSRKLNLPLTVVDIHRLGSTSQIPSFEGSIIAKRHMKMILTMSFDALLMLGARR